MKPIRFRLRTFLILVTIVGVGAGLLGTRWYANQQRKIVESEVKRLSGMIVYAKGSKTKKRLWLSGDKITDDELHELVPRLKFLPEIVELDLVTAPVTDKSLPRIGAVKQLELLHVYKTQVTEAGIKKLQLQSPKLTIKQSMPDPVATTLVSRKIYRHAVISLALNETKSQPTLISGNGYGEFEVFGPGQRTRKIKAHDNWTFSARFNHKGNLLATGGGDNLIRFWDTQTWQPVSTIDEASGDVHSMAFSSDDRFLYTVGDDMTVRRFDLQQQPPEVLMLGDHDDTIPTLSLHPNGKLLATGSRDDSIRLWDAITGEQLETINGHDDDVVAVQFHPTEPWLLSASYDKSIRIWDYETKRQVARLVGYKKRIFDASWDATGEQIATAAEDGVRIWDTRSFKTKVRLTQSAPVSRVQFTGDGRQLWFADANGFLTEISTATGKVSTTHGTSRLDLLRRNMRIRVSAKNDDSAEMIATRKRRSVTHRFVSLDVSRP